MNSEENNAPKKDSDILFEGGTGNDQKTTRADKKKMEEQDSYEGLRSSVINPDDEENREENKETGKE